MNGRRAVIGLSLLCALAFSAFAAPSASAIKGTTAFTCVEKEGGKFKGEHCLSTGTGAYEHQEIEAGKTVEGEGTNEKTAQTTTSAAEALLTATVSGIQTEISCETQNSTGSLTNQTTETVEKEKYMRIKGEKIVTTFTGCVTRGTLAELGCTIRSGPEKEGGKLEAIVTNELTAESKDNSTQIEFKPPEKKSFTTFELLGEKCSLKGAKEVTGTFKGRPEGATIRFSNLTTTGLKFGGASASFTGAHTVRGSGGGNPAVATTTEP